MRESPSWGSVGDPRGDRARCAGDDWGSIHSKSVKTAYNPLAWGKRGSK